MRSDTHQRTFLYKMYPDEKRASVKFYTEADVKKEFLHNETALKLVYYSVQNFSLVYTHFFHTQYTQVEFTSIFTRINIYTRRARKREKDDGANKSVLPPKRNPFEINDVNVKSRFQLPLSGEQRKCWAVEQEASTRKLGSGPEAT